MITIPDLPTFARQLAKARFTLTQRNPILAARTTWDELDADVQQRWIDRDLAVLREALR